MNILLAVGILALVTFTGSLVYVARVVVSYITDSSGTVAESMGTIEVAHRLDKQDARIDRLTEAVAEGIVKVTRNENRIQKTVTSARRLVREAGLEHAGIEAEYEELQRGNDDPIEPMPALPEEVEAIRIVRIPGGSLEIGAA